MNSEDRREILGMVASGKIDIDEASRLLSGVEIDKPAPEETIKVLMEEESQTPGVKGSGNGDRPRWFHVHVSDMKTGKSKVKVNIPIRLVKYGLSIGKRFAPEVDGLDFDELSSYMSNEKGLLVDVQDDEDGERVLIYVD
jgi:hypothetical protein